MISERVTGYINLVEFVSVPLVGLVADRGYAHATRNLSRIFVNRVWDAKTLTKGTRCRKDLTTVLTVIEIRTDKQKNLINVLFQTPGFFRATLCLNL